MSRRDRILVLSQCLPFPPNSGVTNRTYHVLTELQKEFDVSLLAFSRRNHQGTPEAREAAAGSLRQVLSQVLPPVAIPGEWNSAVRLADHGRSLASGRPYTYYEYSAPGFESSLRAAMAAVRPVLVHMDSLDLYRWRRAVNGVPTACTHHSIESDLLRLRAEHFRSRVLGRYLRLQASLIERVERKESPSFALNVMMSDLDGKRLLRVAPGSSVYTAPNGVDTRALVPSSDPPLPGRVVFLGPTYMFPNRDGVDHFLARIWPGVRTRVPSATFHLVGKNADEDRRRYEGHDGVTCNGFVPDIRPHLAGAACSVVPLRVGGGTRLKILDSWALGVPVVSTTVGCEGLEARDGVNILVRDDPESFAEAVAEVLRTGSLRDRLRTEGRRTVERSYSWDAVGEGLRKAYRALL